jgi:hypothetical protein
MTIGKAYILVGALAVVLMLGSVIAGGIVGILAVLLYFAAQHQETRARADAAEHLALLERQRAQRDARRPPPEALPSDGSIPARRPGESTAHWAARVQSTEAAAFRRRHRSP